MKKDILQETFEKHVRLMKERLNLNENENQDPVKKAYEALQWLSESGLNEDVIKEETEEVLRELLSKLSTEYNEKDELSEVIEKLKEKKEVKSKERAGYHLEIKSVEDIIKLYNKIIPSSDEELPVEELPVEELPVEEIDNTIETIKNIRNTSDPEWSRSQTLMPALKNLLIKIDKDAKTFKKHKQGDYESDGGYDIERYMKDLLEELKEKLDKEKYEELETAYKNVPGWDWSQNY